MNAKYTLFPEDDWLWFLQTTIWNLSLDEVQVYCWTSQYYSHPFVNLGTVTFVDLEGSSGLPRAYDIAYIFSFHMLDYCTYSQSFLQSIGFSKSIYFCAYSLGFLLSIKWNKCQLSEIMSESNIYLLLHIFFRVFVVN